MASKYKAGDTVVLGKHTYHQLEGSNWNSNMNKYVGQAAVLQRLYSNGDDQTRSWIVDIDRGGYAWREINFTDYILIKDQVCSGCQKPCSHKAPNQPDKTYVCDACKIIYDLSC
jgi:hypothetical protein